MLSASPATTGEQMTTPAVSAGSGCTEPQCRNHDRHHGARSCWSRCLPLLVPPGSTKAWVTPRPGETSRQLVIQGGFVVDDGRVRRLARHARQLGFPDLRSYLQAVTPATAFPGSPENLASATGLSPRCWKRWASCCHPGRSGWRCSDAAMPRSGSPSGSSSLASRRSGRTWKIGSSGGSGCWAMSPPSLARTAPRCVG